MVHFEFKTPAKIITDDGEKNCTFVWSSNAKCVKVVRSFNEKQVTLQ